MTPAKGQAGSFSGDFICISASLYVVVSLMAAQMQYDAMLSWSQSKVVVTFSLFFKTFFLCEKNVDSVFVCLFVFLYCVKEHKYM